MELCNSQTNTPTNSSTQRSNQSKNVIFSETATTPNWFSHMISLKIFGLKSLFQKTYNYSLMQMLLDWMMDVYWTLEVLIHLLQTYLAKFLCSTRLKKSQLKKQTSSKAGTLTLWLIREIMCMQSVEGVLMVYLKAVKDTAFRLIGGSQSQNSTKSDVLCQL